MTGMDTGPASAQWYERVFRLSRVPVQFPHYPDNIQLELFHMAT